MNMLKQAGVGLFALLLGAIIGAWGSHKIERPQLTFIAVAAQERDLSESVMLLKVLDEGKADLAKSMLESKIQSSLKVAPEYLAYATDSRLSEMFEKSIAMARLAIADRSKSYTQLQQEVAK